MSQIAAFKKELEKESVATRKMLSVVPTDKFDWKPHPKSMTIKALAEHLVDVFTWFGMTLTTSELDFAKNPYKPEGVTNTPDLVALFEKNLAQAIVAFDNGKDEQLTDRWVLRSGEDVYVDDAKYDVVRMCFGQIIHHRAQLGVFLRLLNVPIPGCYGPSADELGL